MERRIILQREIIQEIIKYRKKVVNLYLEMIEEMTEINIPNEYYQIKSLGISNDGVQLELDVHALLIELNKEQEYEI